jgi:alpha-galactosidase
MKSTRIFVVALLCLLNSMFSPAQLVTAKLGLKIAINPKSGQYTVRAPNTASPVFTSDVGASVDHRWIHGSEYPHHDVTESSTISDVGASHRWVVSFAGRADVPDILYTIQALPNAPFFELQVRVRNGTSHAIHVQSIRSIETSGALPVALGASDAQDRVLSDSFSEDHPQLAIRDLGDSDAGMHRAVGSQLIYNRQSHQSLFVGALTSNHFLTFMNLAVSGRGQEARIKSLQVDAEGTTGIQRGYSLRHATAEDQVELSLPLAPGESLESEKLLVGLSDDYLAQLAQYGTWIKMLHHARVASPSSMGWWSWTAYYFGLNEGIARSNAQWLAQHLKPLGYNFFHVDEGYQFARGEYTTPDATGFPHGMAALEKEVTEQGLIPGLWTAPFQVSERSWVYQRHPEWLVANAKGRPIRLGFVTDNKDQLYVLDPTHPGAQEYLRKTYRTLVRDWGIRYIKLDFMDDAAIEGYYHRPNTTAMEAQTIGLTIIREAVGDAVLLDKDGSAMLNPVGIVDTGRISQDTGHTFGATKEAASGVAARFYMNRNFFVSDPDAYSVSKQVLTDQTWHGGEVPLTLDEAKVSIALSAVAGGMYEIGDDLPRFSEEPERLALVENRDLINMALLGRASLPIDLMTYPPEDQQPSIFVLKETARQSILTVFNWTDVPRVHRIPLESVGLSYSTLYTVTDVFDGSSFDGAKNGVLLLEQPKHSVRVLKIDGPDAPRAPKVRAEHISHAVTGCEVYFTAGAVGPKEAITAYAWDFGDGVTADGAKSTHTYTHAGKFNVRMTATGVEGMAGEDHFTVDISGQIPTTFDPGRNRRQHTPE